MTFPLESLSWIALFGLVGAFLRLFWAFHKPEKGVLIRTILIRLFWPHLTDSSVIVFHYTTIVGIAFVASAIAFGRLEWKDWTLRPAPVQGSVTLDALNLPTNGVPKAVTGELVFSLKQEAILGTSVQRVFRGLVALLLGLLATSSFTTLLLKLHVKGLTVASGADFQAQMRAKTNEIHRDLRSQYPDEKNAERTLLRSIHHLEDLDPNKANAPATKPSVPEIHLIVAVDSELPNPYPPPPTTVLFSQLQTVWARRYKEKDAGAVAKFSPDAGGWKMEVALVPEYFAVTKDDTTGTELDRLLTNGLMTCLRQLHSNHSKFGIAPSSLKQIVFPRAIRLLFGSAESLVETAADFQRFPRSAFPPLTDPEPVLNLWLNSGIGRTLFEVAQAGGGSKALFHEFDYTWETRIKDYLGQHGFSDVENTDIFKHSQVFGLPEKDWYDLDCLMIGSRLFQEGYKLPVVEEKEYALIATVGLLPIVLAALQFKGVLSFPDIVNYVNAHVGRAREGSDQTQCKARLVKQLADFQERPDGLNSLQKNEHE